MPTLPAWATQKVGPLPVWGWGALSLAGGVGFVLYRRRSSSSKAPTLATGAQAVPSQYPMASGDAGGAPGGFGSGDFAPGGPGGFLAYPTQQDPSQTQQPALQQTAQPASQPAYGGPPAVSILPSLLGGGYLASQTQLQNPAGSANRDALASYNPATGLQGYTPSLTDYSTEQPGGIQTVQAGLPGTQPAQGLTYSIYGTNTGSGAVVPADQRIAGERFDAYGRVIA